MYRLVAARTAGLKSRRIGVKQYIGFPRAPSAFHRCPGLWHAGRSR
jgi:hypothetical protein